jgi:hypothetical protein
LALVFIIIVGGAVALLTSWVTNDLSNSTHFTNARNLDYAATSATEVAINSIRYTPLAVAGETLNSNPPNYCWGTSSPSSLTTDGYDVAVWCSTAEDLQSAQTRTVTFYACLSSVSATQCAASPFLQAIVIYDDYPPGGSQPLTKQCTTYCGEGAQLESWDWGTDSNGTTVTSANSISVTSVPPALAPLNSTYTPVATALSGDTVTITSATPTICTVASGVVTFNSDGTCTIDYNDPGNINFAPAPQVQQTVSVGQLTNTITVTSTKPSNAQAGGATYTPTATATSGDSVVITSASTSICTVSSGVVTFVGGGTCTLDFNDPGNANYAPAAQAQQIFSVSAATPAGADVQGVSSGGNLDGKPDNGDEILFTFNQVMSPSSLMSGFTGTSTSVYVQLNRSYSGSTTLKVCTSTYSCNYSAVNLGSVNLGDGYNNHYYVGSFSTVYLNATMSMTTVNSESVVTVTLGTVSGSGTISALSPTTTQTTLVWTPSSSATNPSGVNCLTTSVTQSGAPKQNF